MPTKEKFKGAVADVFVDADMIAEKAAESLKIGFYEILNDPEERDPEMWYEAAEELGIDGDLFIDTEFEDLFATEIDERDGAWNDLVAGMIAVADEQAKIEILYIKLLSSVESGAGKVAKEAKKLSKQELKDAAVEGVGRSRFDSALERRKRERTEQETEQDGN